MAGDIASIIYAYQKKRRDLGRPCEFAECQPDNLVDFMPEWQRKEEWTALTLVEYEASCIPSVSEVGTNTERTASVRRGQLHLEGCWPKDVDADDVEHKLRYRRKAEKDDGYLPAVRGLVDSASRIVAQNNAVDIYEQYFALADAHAAERRAPAPAAGGDAAGAAAPPGAPPGAGGEEGQVQTLTVFGDPLVGDPRTGKVPTVRPQRSVCCVAWQPVDGHHGRRMAVAYANLRRPHPNATACVLGAGESLDSYIWDLTNSNAPELTLEPPSQLLCLEYNTKDLHLLGGGCEDGVLCCFDCRRGGRPVLSTPLFTDDAAEAATGAADAVGAGGVSSIRWLQSSGKGHEVLAANGSETVRVWDTRQLRDPIDTIRLHTGARGGGDAAPGGHAALCLDYDAASGGASRFLAGTAAGAVFHCSRRGRSPSDRVLSVHTGHHGPVCSVRRNPHVPAAFLSCGDWTVRVWHDELRTPLITSRYHRSQLVDAQWHPAHAGLFVTAQLSGRVDVWNLVYKQHEPLLSTPVTHDRLHCLRLHPCGELAAAGAANGRVHLLRLPPALVDAAPPGGAAGVAPDGAEAPGGAGRDAVAALIEREAARERNLTQQRRRRRESAAEAVAQQVDPMQRRRSAGGARAASKEQERELMRLTARYISEMEQRCFCDDVSAQVGQLRKRFVDAAPADADAMLDALAEEQREEERREREAAALAAAGRPAPVYTGSFGMALGAPNTGGSPSPRPGVGRRPRTPRASPRRGDAEGRAAGFLSSALAPPEQRRRSLMSDAHLSDLHREPSEQGSDPDDLQMSPMRGTKSPRPRSSRAPSACNDAVGDDDDGLEQVSLVAGVGADADMDTRLRPGPAPPSSPPLGGRIVGPSLAPGGAGTPGKDSQGTRDSRGQLELKQRDSTTQLGRSAGSAGKDLPPRNITPDSSKHLSTGKDSGRATPDMI